jgi:hypothetical protein
MESSWYCCKSELHFVVLSFSCSCPRGAATRRFSYCWRGQRSTLKDGPLALPSPFQGLTVSRRGFLQGRHTGHYPRAVLRQPSGAGVRWRLLVGLKTQAQWAAWSSTMDGSSGMVSEEGPFGWRAHRSCRCSMRLLLVSGEQHNQWPVTDQQVGGFRRRAGPPHGGALPVSV